MALRHLEFDRAAARLPSRFGDLRITVFRPANGETEVVALTHGEVKGGTSPVLVRLHSECLTGEALGSLRCDCGDQLADALARIARAERGVLLYLRHEGRGIGLFDKIRAYALQDGGLDTVDANVALGLPVDARDYAVAAAVLRRLGVRQVRLMTNNPAKIEALTRNGIVIAERVPVEVPPNPVNLPYLRTKRRRMGHLLQALDLGARPIASHAALPAVTVHYAQTLDGRIATRTGDSRWVSGDGSLRLAHELRAAHDAVLVGIGTVLKDDPRLTVRLAEGGSPVRVVVDSSLRVPLGSNVLRDRAVRTIVATTDAASPERALAVRAAHGEILHVGRDEDGCVDLGLLLRQLRHIGIASVLVEGGRGIITSVLRDGLADRLIVCVAPKVVGAGIEAVGELGIERLRDAIPLRNARFMPCGEDVIFDAEPARAARALSRGA